MNRRLPITVRVSDPASCEGLDAVVERPGRRERLALSRWFGAVIVLSTLFAGLSGAPSAHAQSIPWMPSAAARHAVELLVDDAGLDLPTTQWPLPRAAVSRALDRLPRELAPPLDAARERLMRELRTFDAGALALTVRSHADALPGFGDDETPGSSIALRSSLLSGPRVAFQVGGRIETHPDPDRGGSQFRLDDTALVTEAFGVQLQAFAHRHWWSPGWQSALALGNNAPPISGIGLQRASASTSESPWLAWLGPWNVDFFIGQAEGVSEPAHPFLVGARLTLRPFRNVEIGVTRTAQWGGAGRDTSARSFLRLVTGSGTNADTTAAQARDPGNEMAGFDVRVRCPSALRCAAYTQLIGEDEAGHLPSRILGLYGVEFWPGDGNDRIFAEYAETGCNSPIGRPFLRGCAYRNYAYPQGYVSGGRWLGSSFGPDSRVLTLGWLADSGESSLKLHVGRIGSRSGAFIPQGQDAAYAGRLVGVSARTGIQWGAAVVTPELDWERVRTVDGIRSTTRIGATLRMGIDDAVGSTSTRLGNLLSSANPSSLTPVLVGAGLIGAAAWLDRPLEKYAMAHGQNPSARALTQTGDLLPIAGVGLAGLSWILQRESTQGDVGFAALSAGVSAVAIGELVKYGVDRARPTSELGSKSFGQASRGQSSFPSLHSALAWAVVTPYAKQYDAPWLYGAAALTNAARVLGRAHWFSDTVAGAVLGYWLGDRFYRMSGAASDDSSDAKLWLSPSGIHFSMPFR